jgi:group I intron endonuclease
MKFLVSKENRHLSGIYAIRVEGGSKYYIGSTKNFRERFNVHRRRLVKGVHHSPGLQNAWNKHGSDSFSFEIIEICETIKDTIISLEQKWIDEVGIKNLYNVCPVAGSSLGVRTPLEIRKKIGSSLGGKSFPGVSFNETRNIWRAVVNRAGKKIHLGYFDTENEAIIARIKYDETEKVPLGRAIQRNNTSGFTGVYCDKRSGKWASTVNSQGCQKFLGCFNTPEEANSARLVYLSQNS